MSNTHPMELSRRDFLRISKQYGLKTALFAASVGGFPGLQALTKFAASDAHAQTKAAYRLRFGATIVTPSNEIHLNTGMYEFARKVEELSDGQISIQLIDKSQACVENNCGDRVANDILDIGGSTPQNLGQAFPFSIALDWPFLWQDRTGYHNFLFSSKSNRLYRDVMRKAYGIVPLFGSGEMRNVLMGLKYSGKELIKNPGSLVGAKIRITNSDMIRAFAVGLKMNPVPLAYTELLEGLKSGVVDAAETWPAAATAGGMHTVLSQDVGIEFSPGFEMTFISARVFDQLPDRLKSIMLEAAWQTMTNCYQKVEDARNKIVGHGDNPLPETGYLKAKIRQSKLTTSERAEFVALAGVETNGQLYGETRSKLDKIAGFDVYGALKEYAQSVANQPLKSDKWWTQ